MLHVELSVPGPQPEVVAGVDGDDGGCGIVLGHVSLALMVDPSGHV